MGRLSCRKKQEPVGTSVDYTGAGRTDEESVSEHKATFGDAFGRAGWADIRKMVEKGEKARAKEEREKKAETKRKEDELRAPTVSKKLQKHKDRT